MNRILGNLRDNDIAIEMEDVSIVAPVVGCCIQVLHRLKWHHCFCQPPKANHFSFVHFPNNAYQQALPTQDPQKLQETKRNKDNLAIVRPQSCQEYYQKDSF